MIRLPIERMLKPAANRGSVADDRTVDESLGKAVAETLRATATFGETPFGRAGAWSYVGGQKPFNLADGIPDVVLKRLSEDSSLKLR
jgi:hypothetical protein